MALIILSTTAPTLLLNPNEKRRKIAIQMQPVDVDANNSGRIHLGFGSQPVATVGHPDQGLILIGGAGLEEPSGITVLDKKYKQILWATSSVANQSLTLNEELETNG